ncbi:hypothetical protein A2291_04410 [candidate division WOR-1 bacterium RIFOXYB2_FULL_42_35]|uniref:Peptidase S8/S53 domain-containing protein n=1 Tax=candidate division WOR-1 bacterium RIFOXYC2_FULL_41_25 TaxID=1802586 RepID=A0A1F4TRI2_UNCSA|nr:MAG: hypothetical protein A2247_07525 [candidate division WOR-1 bacterium RIFOXYA2_FULL_41_14]OGC25807.1 MAG: hypothetical protein A2291_04410 [candidate division WOR-1 bacterium RIFOXYB2_FULL_42_35]OGC35247.1 MAG: hypothetical protein A2462_08400 [candidate division WOR-1 bacterium RIFOXYC2_FULL_41_25]OGC41770.1 MAG: hypothetical protein A2548_02750 [candidate division WOR-1 bacterium RIFOXYD2_FULL_41_8]
MEDQRSKIKDQNGLQAPISKSKAIWNLGFGIWSLLGILIFGFWVSLSSLSLADYAPGQILVQFKPEQIVLPQGATAFSVDKAQFLSNSVQALSYKTGVYKIKQLYSKALENRPDWTHLKDYYVIYFPEDKNVETVAAEYQNNPDVVSASPDEIAQAYATIPNDTYYSSQYGLTNISAPSGWDQTTGSSSVVIAVLDSGIDSNHEDLAAKIDSHGWDFVNNDDDPEDDFGHGTKVSGVLGAVTNNGKGVAGVDWQAKILPLKVLDSSGTGTNTNIKAAIAYASSRNVDVMNMSFGFNSSPSGLQSTCSDAYNNGAVLVAAAGNDNVTSLRYPAGYDTVLAIASVDSSDIKSSFSNYGSWISVCAPGSSIMTTTMDGSYYLGNNGTSFAAPFVAGLAALMKAQYPAMTVADITNAVTTSADNIDAQNPTYLGDLGSGRINVSKALAAITAAIASPESNSYIKGSVEIYGTAAGQTFSSYEVLALQAGSVVASIGSSTTAATANLLATWDTTAVTDGNYTVAVNVYSTVAGVSDEASIAIVIDNTPPQALIATPTSGATVTGDVTISGTATDFNFDKYYLEYGQGASPTIFTKIRLRPLPAYGEESYSTVEAGVLGTWETAGLSGQYTLKLTAYDQTGATSLETILLNLQNSSEPAKAAETQTGLPMAYALPNPFVRSSASTVTFNYSLQGNFNTSIYLFDLTGTLIWQQNYIAGENGAKAGSNDPSWNGIDLFGTSVPNGVYIFQVISGNKVIAKGKLIAL